MKKRSFKKRNLPTLLWEKKAKRLGYKCVAGIDEAGRGPLAGPVVAACVVLEDAGFTVKIDDSKRLSAGQRERAYREIIQKSRFGIGIVFEDIIEDINIRNATTLAMERALFNLPIRADSLLIDGITGIRVPIKQFCIIKGDQKSLSIAAASIIAKVTRDRLMRFYDKLFPEYGFAIHKGYGTRAHFEAIEKYGLAPLHRKSFIE